MTCLVTYHLAPNEVALIVERPSFDRAWAFANDNARHNKAFRLLSIVDKETGIALYRG